MPSLVVPPWTSPTSLSRATRNRSHELSGSSRGEHAGVGDEAQGRAVRRALVVVGDVLARGVRAVVVAQPLEQPPQLLAREQEEQHHRVGLLGELVAVGVVALGTQDPVEPLDVPVLGAVGVPVELLEILVALELADDAVAVEGNEHPAAHVRPRAQLLVAEAQLPAQRVGPGRRAGARGPRCAMSHSHATMTLV